MKLLKDSKNYAGGSQLVLKYLRKTSELEQKREQICKITGLKDSDF